MLRIVTNRLGRTSLNTVVCRSYASEAPVTSVLSDCQLSDEEFDEKYVKYFSRPDIDHWEIRSAMNNLAGMELVPEPKIICAALRACRRLNDYALTTRFLESIKNQAAGHVKVIYPYILQEIKPTLDELGISTPEELGYDKPELALECVDDIN